MRTIPKLACITIAFLCATTAGIVRAELLTFDALPGGGPLDVDPSIVPNGYGGLEWNNFAVLNGLEFPSDYGYFTGVVSPDNIAFNEFGNAASMAIVSGSFNLDSAYLTSALNSYPTLSIQVEGFRGGSLVYNNIYTVNNHSPTLINFNYLGVNTVTFSSGVEFAMDNVTVDVPEPSIFRLMLVGAACITFVYSKQKTSKRSAAAT